MAWYGQTWGNANNIYVPHKNRDIMVFLCVFFGMNATLYFTNNMSLLIFGVYTPNFAILFEA